MADVETGMVDLLEASAGVTALVGSPPDSRIYPDLVPPGFDNYPAITYQIISETREPTLTKQHGLMRARVQLTAWARDPAGRKNLAEAIRNAIDGNAVTFPSGVFIEDGTNKVEASAGNRRGRVYGKDIDALAWVTQDDPTHA